MAPSNEIDPVRSPAHPTHQHHPGEIQHLGHVLSHLSHPIHEMGMYHPGNCDGTLVR